jgi:uncharacterized protein YdiU (UPF0061 family)
VGSFLVLAARQDYEGLTALFEHAVERHYPQAQNPLAFLNAVIAAQASLIAKWLSVGFIHGVMNTDNCAISGETIDYGPCAFMDNFHQMTVFSSIDRRGRYAYGNQADIIVWNMAQLATSLVPLMPDVDQAVADFTKAIHAMPELIRDKWRQAFGAKLGLENATADDDVLINDLLHIMSEQSADFTNTFRSLHLGSAHEQFTDIEPYNSWHIRWKNRLKTEDSSTKVMRQSNPWIIPRNHQVEATIQAAVSGDYQPFHQLNAALATPFEDDKAYKHLTRPPEEEQRVMATFCGT